MRRVLLAALSILFSSISWSQQYVEIAKYQHSTSQLNSFEGSNASTRVIESKSGLFLPIPVSKNFTILTGTEYEHVETAVVPNDEQRTFSSLAFKVGLNLKLKKDVSVTSIALPKFACSRQSNTFVQRNFQLGGILLIRKTISKYRNYRYGIYANSELFGPFIVPIYGAYILSKDELWEWTIMAPIALDVNRQLNDHFFGGLNYFGQVRSFTYSAEEYLTKTSNEPYLYLRWSQNGRNKGLMIDGSIGYSLGRSYRIYRNEDGASLGFPLIYLSDDRVQQNVDFEDGLLFKISARYRVGID